MSFEALAAAVSRYAKLERRLFRTNVPMSEREFDRACNDFEAARAEMFKLAGVKEEGDAKGATG